MGRPLPELFRDIPWRGPEVLRETIRRARDHDLALEILEPWYDVDDGAALSRLAGEIRESGASRAPATARYLATLLDGTDEPVL